jgi:hypothetical protein
MKKLVFCVLKAGFMQFPGGFQNQLTGSVGGQSAVNC